MNAKNWIPWVVAASAMLFAMIVLVRNEISPRGQSYADMSRPQQPVIQPAAPAWQPSSPAPPPATPEVADYSPWSNTQRVDTPIPLATRTPAVTPVPTPT